jgi:plastocyanin
VKRAWPILIFAAAITITPDEANAERYTVLVKSMPNEFVPADLSILTGDSVVWTWISGAHTVTADNGSFDSGIRSKPYRFRQPFFNPGDYWYYCTLHGEPGGIGHAGVVRVSSRDWDDDDDVPELETVPIRRP